MMDIMAFVDQKDVKLWRLDGQLVSRHDSRRPSADDDDVVVLIHLLTSWEMPTK